MTAARRHPASLPSVERWYDLLTAATCGSLNELRRTFPTADQVGNTLIFNIAGNNFRLLGCVDWADRRVFFRELLTHAQYDKINPEHLCP